MPRLFTGLEIPSSISLELSLMRGGLNGARWTEPEDYHITLRFIGDVDPSTAREIDACLREIRRGPLDVTLNGLGSFGGDRPRALIVNAQPSPALLDMQLEQERLMRRLGLAPEVRKYTPHVTLARMRGNQAGDVARYLGERGLFATRSFTAPRFVLYSSRESVGGGPYVVEAAYPLE